MQTAFDVLKKTLILVLYLALLDLDGEFKVTTNALKDTKAVGAVLIQDNYPVVYKSTKLNVY